MKKKDRPEPWRLIGTEESFSYINGLRVGDKLRLLRDFDTLDHLKRPIERHVVGEIWTVAIGAADEPDVIWLLEPGGDLHGWKLDSSFDTTFARIVPDEELQ